MILFNVPPYLGTEDEYVLKAIKSHKICGDGEYTAKCNGWLEKETGAAKYCLPLPVRMQRRWQRCFLTSGLEMR